jgi:ABC-type Fe3+-hydroxamate transport system substrate-binding protein
MRGLTLALCLLLAAPARADAPAPSDAPARRVVSLNPSLTAMAIALGARAQLVGVDDYSARSPEAAGLATVGGLYNPSLEAVVALAPDLVVFVPSAEQRGFEERLAALAVPRLALDPVSYEDVLAAITTLGARLGREREAEARVAKLRETRARVAAAARGLPELPGVLVLQRDPLFVAGGGTFVDDMLASLHIRNLAAEQPGHWPRLAREWLLAAGPELILDASPDPEPAGAYWARWPSLPAVASGRVVDLPEGVSTLPGPDLDRALLALAAAARGPQFVAGLGPEAP